MPLYMETNNIPLFWDYISNRGYNYYKMPSSKEFEIISRFKVNNNRDVIVEFYSNALNANTRN